RICRVDLGTVRREIDVEKVALFDFFMSDPVREYELAVHHLRLVAEPIEPALELLADPFEGGAVRVRGAAGRPALYRVEIRDDQGVPVDEHAEQTARFDWRWSGGVPGRYRVHVSVVDLDWGVRSDEGDLGEFAVVPEPLRPGLVVWAAATTRKIALDAQPSLGQMLYGEKTISRGGGVPLRLELARNEVEGLQLVFRAQRSAAIELAVEELVHADGTAFPPDATAWRQVGYVFTRRPGEYPVDLAGWCPDPLLPRSQLALRREDNQVAWLSLRTTSRTAPGIYRGRVAVQIDGMRLGSIPLEVQVHAATLPDSTAVRTAFSLYGHMLENVYGAGRLGAMTRRYMDFLVDHRLNPDHLYRRHPPSLEALAGYARQGRLNAFNLLYIDAEQDYDREGLIALARRLDPLVARLDSLGLMDWAYIYGFDEIESGNFAALQRVFAFVKNRYPGLRTATTARDPGLGLDNSLGELVDIWVPLTAAYEEQTAARARLQGDEVWWYICIAPIKPHANWFIEYPAIEARLLWWMAHRQGVEGFLYYATNRWPDQRVPLRADAHGRARWNPASYGTANGDGSLFYPGPEGPIGSIRLENIRDGIEDYQLLEALAVRDGVEEARALSGQLVRSLVDFTRDPAEFARVRGALLESLSKGQP
ncbi:MAG: DUF4091 domain-containing protein, partial [Candidatus Latescibacterota bacterium]|nr:DUF4091 domain-containing protein [Candidatus Latescibacterota bacterium]